METFCRIFTLQKSLQSLRDYRGGRLNCCRAWIRRWRKTNELLEKRPVCAWWAVDYQIYATKTHQSALLIFVQYKGALAFLLRLPLTLHCLNTTTVGGQPIGARWYRTLDDIKYHKKTCIFVLSVYSNYCKYLLTCYSSIHVQVSRF